MLKIQTASARDMRCKFYPWVSKIPWKSTWQPTSVFLSGESHGQRSLMGYSMGSWGLKESDTNEMTSHMCTRNSVTDTKQIYPHQSPGEL